MPVRSSEEAACFDVFSIEYMLILPGYTIPIKTGLKLEIPKGYEIEIRPRSGLSYEGLTIANSPGTIDSDYRGELQILLHNSRERYHSSTTDEFRVEKGDRIAQIKLNRVYPTEFVESEELSTTERGSGGFGSTGK